MSYELSSKKVCRLILIIGTEHFQIFGKPDPNIPEISQLVQHGFARSSRWEYLGKSSSESSKLPNNAGDSSVKLDFGLEDSMITDLKWKGKFSLIYSVTLSTEDLETSIVVRNTGTENFSFKFLFHSYFRVNVSYYPKPSYVHTYTLYYKCAPKINLIKMKMEI